MSEEDRPEFSVCQFFTDGTYEYVRRYVHGLEAVEAFRHYTTNVAVAVGVVERVIITDGGDSINMEWKKGHGITFPPEALHLNETVYKKDRQSEGVK